MTEEEIKRHIVAAEKLALIKDGACGFIRKKLGRVSEYDVQKFILSEFKKEGLVTDKKYNNQIVAVNENSSFVHYFPSRKGAKVIKENSLILIDIWARLKKENSPFADITWMAYSGKNVPKEIQATFDKIVKARNFALAFIRENLRKGKLPKTKAVDKTVRDYFKKLGLERCFLHGLGHSLGMSECHGKYFRFGKKSQAELKPNIPFTIEPGLYFKDKFGVRSEINCYITKNRELKITTKIQNKIIEI